MRRLCLINSLATVALVFLSAACGRDEAPPPAGAARKITMQLNWKPEPEFGPFFAAQVGGHFQAEGLEVELRAGGSSAPTTDLLAAKQVPFAIVSADQIILSRAVGKKIVGVFAVYQKDPMCLMTHKARGFKSLPELLKAPGTLAIERGMPFATWLEKTVGFGSARIVPSPYGDLKYLRSDPSYALQGFATSEPEAAKRQGIDVDVFLVADLGFDTYQTVLAVHEDTLNQDLDLVVRMVRAVTKGWEGYMLDPLPVNKLMGSLNTTMDAETFAAVTVAQIPHVVSQDTKTRGPGTMSLERWQRLAAQMTESGVVKSGVDAASCFRDPVELIKSK